MRTEGPTVVYFIRFGDRVKVGFSGDLQRRLEKLTILHGSDAILIGALFGGEMLEAAIHQELTAFALGNEFFSFDPVVAQLINRLLSERGAFGLEALTLTDVSIAPEQRMALNEDALVTEALEGVEKLMAVQATTRSAAAMAAVTKLLGAPRTFVWTLRYRRPRFITAGQLDAIRREVLALELAAVDGLDQATLND